MKRFVCLLFALVLLPIFCFADLPDISGLSYDELVQLRDQINLAMWNSEEWQEVTVPKGLYQIGVDIPAGHWTIKPAGDDHGLYQYSDQINSLGTEVEDSYNYWFDIISTRKNNDGTWKYTDAYHEFSLNMQNGFYIYLPCDTIFTPYAGKPGLGFK